MCKNGNFINWLKMKERNNKKRASAAGRREKHSGMLAGQVNALTRRTDRRLGVGGYPPPPSPFMVRWSPFLEEKYKK